MLHPPRIHEGTLQGLPPIYVIDQTFQLIWWNWAFDEAIAKPAKLSVGQPVTALLQHLDNRKECEARIAKVFAVGNTPLYDIEPIHMTFDLGPMRFTKVACRVFGNSDRENYWSVILNVDSSEEAYWDAVSARMQTELQALASAKGQGAPTPSVAIHGGALLGLTPTYLLDLNYNFCWWNWAFDELVAGPLSFEIGQQATDFVRKLDNRRDVLERSARVFAVDRVPLMDMEPILVTTQPYGQIRFRKIACQVAAATPEDAYWVVHLNVDGVEHPGPFWDAVASRLDRETATLAGKSG